MASKSPFADLFLNVELIPDCIAAAGAADITINRDNPKEYKLHFSYEGQPRLIRLYPKTGGIMTIGKANGHTEIFDVFAEIIKAGCCIEKQQRLEFTVKMTNEQFSLFIEFLISEQVAIVELNPEAHCKVFEATGHLGDKLRIKFFNNKSVQVQGRFLNTAFLTNDFLCNILDRSDLVTHQIETFKIPITQIEMSDELLHKMPVSNGAVHEMIMKQIACALTLSKIEIALDDYSSITHSALRGLEGYIFQVLQRNFKPEKSTKVGEYFERDHTGRYDLTADRHGTCGHAEMAGVLGDCYTYWHDNRHGLFHMSPILAGTLTIDIGQARKIVDEVCALIEKSVKRLI